MRLVGLVVKQVDFDGESGRVTTTRNLHSDRHQESSTRRHEISNRGISMSDSEKVDVQFHFGRRSKNKVLVECEEPPRPVKPKTAQHAILPSAPPIDAPAE